MTQLAARPSTTAHLKKAVHHHKITSKRGMLERMFTMWFRGFVYNQIWEDPRVDAQALQIGPDSSLFTISSGGCNVLNYLIHKPKRIVAVDLNHNHMSLTRLKLAAIQHLRPARGQPRQLQPLHPRPSRPTDAGLLGVERLARQRDRPEADQLLQTRPLQPGKAGAVFSGRARPGAGHAA